VYRLDDQLLVVLDIDLEGLEFEIAEVENGEEAVEACRKRNAGRHPARLEHAENGRLRFLARAASASRERQAEGHVLHH
jgi:hypothetical protein